MAVMRMKNGTPVSMRNAEFIPMYYFIPRRILAACGAELNALPRNPQKILHSKAACDLIESDLFRLLIVDAVAYMVWPYMGFTEYMEVYSGDDPAWRLAHSPEIWIKELTDQGVLPTAESFPDRAIADRKSRRCRTRNRHRSHAAMPAVPAEYSSPSPWEPILLIRPRLSVQAP